MSGKMKCPHCAVAVNESWTTWNLHQEPEKSPNAFDVWAMWGMVCPECGEFIGQLRRTTPDGSVEHLRALVWPSSTTRPVAPEVEDRYKRDFKEAVSVLPLSAKASAALSRRMLQDIIREKAGIKRKDLDKEIQGVIDSNSVPSWLAQNLDAVRAVGNFAAHTTKRTNTGEVVDVEPGEAEFLLDVLEGLFDFYFVQPERARKQREAVDQKLKDAGKPKLKTTGN
jgi:uncharacterized protein DUF4145